jgi:hypothetical protein
MTSDEATSDVQAQKSTSKEVRDLADHLEFVVRGGQGIGAACDMLKNGFLKVDPALVDAGRAEYEKRMKIIEFWDAPGALENGGVIKSPVPSWYGGPKEGDYFWPPLRSRLTKEISDAIADVDTSSSRVISLGARPGDELIDTRGLVLGYVQSGKTTNFMSVIAKAADVGFKLIIVLSGITDNLRQQTQQRLGDYIVKPCASRFHLLTTDEHDFSETTNPNALLNSDDLRLLAVVKKNPARLRRLNKWLKKASATTIANSPILVIDDEADQASIDVGNKRQSTINMLIGELLSHPKVAYIAYTATPFANLLIDPQKKDGLYPRNFVVNLPRPDSYFGPERIFGSLSVEEGETPDDGMDIVRLIPDEDVEATRPPKNKAQLEDWVAEVPGTLRNSLLWFLLATSARRLRAGKAQHSSMLVHTSMLAKAHIETAESIEDQLEEIRAGFGSSDPVLMSELRSLWEKETTRVPASEYGNQALDFDQLMAELSKTIWSTKVVVDNYLSNDRLNYDSASPSTAIVVGGNTLSRGLTLEGLISSFFIRASTAYDTLLQMGRWFGYRRGYEDLVRIWMTNELRQWFVALATVEAEIREEIEIYAKEGKTPLELPVRIRTHPQMAVTSAAKMRDAVKARVSYSGKKVQTILFHDQDSNWLQVNQAAVEKMVTQAKSSGHVESELDSPTYRGFKNLDATIVLDFLEVYQVHNDARTINPNTIRSYVLKQIEQDTLKSWNVVFIERKDGTPSNMSLGLDKPLRLLRRRKLMTNDDGTANLKAITSRWDRVADLKYSKAGIAETFTKGNEDKVSDHILKSVRHNQGLNKTGLLVIYPINKDSDTAPTMNVGDDLERQIRTPLHAKDHLIGISIMFPESPNHSDAVDYYSAKVEPGYLEDTEADTAFADEQDEKLAEAEEAMSQ